MKRSMALGLNVSMYVSPLYHSEGGFGSTYTYHVDSVDGSPSGKRRYDFSLPFPSVISKRESTVPAHFGTPFRWHLQSLHYFRLTDIRYYVQMLWSD